MFKIEENSNNINISKLISWRCNH